MNELLLTVLPTATLTAAATAGVVWGTLKATVNGTVIKVAKIETKVNLMGEDVAYIKGKLDAEVDVS